MLQSVDINFSSAGDYVKFCDFVDVDWDNVLNASNVDEMWEKFKSILLDGMDKFIPKGEVRIGKRNFQPFTTELHKLINKKHRLWNRWICTRDDSTFDKYKITRSKVKHETVKLLQQEQHKISLESKTNPKKFWRYVNRRSKTKTWVSDLKGMMMMVMK